MVPDRIAIVIASAMTVTVNLQVAEVVISHMDRIRPQTGNAKSEWPNFSSKANKPEGHCGD